MPLSEGDGSLQLYKRRTEWCHVKFVASSPVAYLVFIY